MHRTLDAQAGLEVDEMRRLPGDGAEQLAAFDDLEVVEAEPMAGRRHELVVRRMRGGGEDGAEALAVLRLVGRVELHLVHALLVVEDAAALTEELEEDAALATPGRAVQQDD